MSGSKQDPVMMTDSLHLNQTVALGRHDEELNTALFEFKVFNIVITALALCILVVTGLYCIIVCCNRTRRQSKRAHVYESAVTSDEPAHPVAVTAVKRSTSFINPLVLFRKPEAAKDNSRIYYIYSNPLPVGLEEEEEKVRATRCPEERTPPTPPLSFEEYVSHSNSSVILDPPIFYMQL